MHKQETKLLKWYNKHTMKQQIKYSHDTWPTFWAHVELKLIISWLISKSNILKSSSQNNFSCCKCWYLNEPISRLVSPKIQCEFAQIKMLTKFRLKRRLLTISWRLPQAWKADSASSTPETQPGSFDAIFSVWKSPLHFASGINRVEKPWFIWKSGTWDSLNMPPAIQATQFNLY